METVLTTELILQLAMTFGSGALGVAVMWGTLRAKVHRNLSDIKSLRSDVNKITGNPTGPPVFVRRDECSAQTKRMNAELATVSDKVDGLQRYARHQLTKAGVPLDKVNEILGEH